MAVRKENKHKHSDLGSERVNLVLLYAVFCSNIFFHFFFITDSRTNTAEHGHGRNSWPNAGTPRTTASHAKSTVILPPKTHENSQTSRTEHSSYVLVTPWCCTNDTTRWNTLPFNWTRPSAIYIAPCKCELL